MNGSKNGFGKRGRVVMPSHGVRPTPQAPEPRSDMSAWVIGAVAAIFLAGLIGSGGFGGGGFLGGLLGGMLANQFFKNQPKTTTAQAQPATSPQTTSAKPAEATRGGFGTKVSSSGGGGGWFGG